MIRENLEVMGVPQEAIAFVMKVWDAIQFLDDVKDGDSPERIDASIHNLLVALPGDEFFHKHRDALVPAMAVAFAKWQAANAAEQDRFDLEKAYMWRAGFYDVVLLVCLICVPDINPRTVLSLYGERFGEYVKEFENA